MINIIATIVILLLMLSVIVSIHEFGHFITAKKNGIYVDEFSIGMGPVLLKHKPKDSETTYCLRVLPIGGFVSMAEKENPENKKIKKDRVLENKSFLAKFCVLIAGIFMNCVLAIFLFFISGLIYGRPVNEPIINEVVEGKPAQIAGLEKGDRIIKINGVNVNTFDDFLLEASAKKIKDNYIIIVEKANKEIKEYNVVPNIIKQENKDDLREFGIVFEGTVHYKGFVEALKYGFTGFYDNTITIFKILGSLFTGEVSVKNLSGPVGMYSIVDQVKSAGFEMILYLTAYLSINVAIINLFPIPVFDGGRIFIIIIEKIIRRKTNEKLETIINLVGFGLLILLMLYVTWNDIVRLVVG